MTFPTTNGGTQALTVSYGGPAVNFVLIVSFAACVYDAILLLFLVLLQCPTIPAPWRFGVDALFTMLFMSAGCALAASDYVRYCDVLDGVVRCTLLVSSAALCFMAFVGFLLSVGWGAWMRNTWIALTIKPSANQPSGPMMGDLELDDERAITSYASSVSGPGACRQEGG